MIVWKPSLGYGGSVCRFWFCVLRSQPAGLFTLRGCDTRVFSFVPCKPHNFPNQDFVRPASVESISQRTRGTVRGFWAIEFHRGLVFLSLQSQRTDDEAGTAGERGSKHQGKGTTRACGRTKQTVVPLRSSRTEIEIHKRNYEARLPSFRLLNFAQPSSFPSLMFFFVSRRSSNLPASLTTKEIPWHSSIPMQHAKSHIS